MTSAFFDSVVYGGVWKDASVAALFEEASRTRDWLEILATLAEVQAECGVIPAAAAGAVAAACRSAEVGGAFLEEVRAGREATAHSTQGLVQAIARRCPGEAGQWACYGMSVQDLADTWFARVLGAAGNRLDELLGRVEGALGALAARHRDTVMAGRTHGQVGAPLTFGLKAAGWVVEVRRGRVRLEAARGRVAVGQLAGSVGAAASMGPAGLEVQHRFCGRLGLKAPEISWTSSRDVVAEWGVVLALATGTADRIAHEVYNLQRPEVGELAEGAGEDVVGSITMPHKRNPERCEHIGTLARLVRHGAAALLEGQVQDHERDGRSWKAEWHLLPEVTIMAAKALALLAEVAEGLEVDTERMAWNLAAARGQAWSEALMLALAPRLGRLSAHARVAAVAGQARALGLDLRAAAERDAVVREVLSPAAIADVFAGAALGGCGEMVDRVIGAAP